MLFILQYRNDLLRKTQTSNRKLIGTDRVATEVMTPPPGYYFECFFLPSDLFPESESSHSQQACIKLFGGKSYGGAQRPHLPAHPLTAR